MYLFVLCIQSAFFSLHIIAMPSFSDHLLPSTQAQAYHHLSLIIKASSAFFISSPLFTTAVKRINNIHHANIPAHQNYCIEHYYHSSSLNHLFCLQDHTTSTPVPFLVLPPQTQTKNNPTEPNKKGDTLTVLNPKQKGGTLTPLSPKQKGGTLTALSPKRQRGVMRALATE